MKNTQRLICAQIVEEIINHPASSLFRKPVDPAVLPDYYKIISNPQDLEGTLNNLKNNEIRSVSQFKRQMNLIWDNAIKYNGINSWTAILAQHCKKMFEKQMKIKVPQSNTQWLEDINLYQNKLNQLTGRPPSNLAKSAPIPMLEMGDEKPLSSDEFKQLFSAANELEDEEKRNELFKYLGKPHSIEALTDLPLNKLRNGLKMMEEAKQVAKHQHLHSRLNYSHTLVDVI